MRLLPTVAHVVQDEACVPLNLPAGQSVHDVESAPANFPAEQLMHLLSEKVSRALHPRAELEPWSVTCLLLAPPQLPLKYWPLPHVVTHVWHVDDGVGTNWFEGQVKQLAAPAPE